MNHLLNKHYKAIGKVAGYLWKKGWAEKNAGNISFNVTDLISSEEIKEVKKSSLYELEQTLSALAGNVFLITSAGSRMREVKKNPQSQICLMQLDNTGSSYRILLPDKTTKESKPTSETPSHLIIHDFLVREQRPERAVLHAHLTETILLSQHPDFKNEEIINNLLWSMQPETSLFIPEGVGFVPFRLPGSYDIAKATIEKLVKHKAVIWEKHGCIVVDKEVEKAFDIMDMISKTIDIYLKCRMAGFEPEGLSKDQIEAIRNSIS